MPRNPLRYGHKVILSLPSSSGTLTSTSSAISPLGVRPEGSADDVPSLEDSIFTFVPGEGEFNSSEAIAVGDEVKFGHVVRLVHYTHRSPVLHLSNEPALLDKGAQRVTIDDPTRFFSINTSAALYRTDRFRILPKYKVRGEGERVCEGDHVLFQSMLSSAAFLSVSHLKDDRTDGCFEVQCTSDGSGLVVRFYDADDSDATSVTIRGGQCVTLVHREVNRLFAAAQISPALDDLQRTVLLDAPLQPHASDPLSIKGITHENLFILEFEDRGRSGPIQVVTRERYRIKSLAANGYVAVDGKKNQLYLTHSLSDLGTLFTLHAASDDREQTLQSGSRVFLEATTGGSESRWIAVGTVPIEVDGVVLPYVGLQTTTEESVSDGIEIQLLPFIEYRDLSRVLALLPPLKRFVTAVTAGSIDATTVAQVRANVRRLRRFCFQAHEDVHSDHASEVDGILDPIGQGRLLHQGVPQLLMTVLRSILSSPFLDRTMLHSNEDITSILKRRSSSLGLNAHAIRYSDILGLIDECLGVIQFVVRDNYRGALTLRPLLPTLIEVSEYIPAAAGCVAEFLRGNVALLEELEDDVCKDLIRFMDLLVQRPRDAVLMQLVGLFTANRDAGFTEAQRVVKGRLIDDVAVRDNLFFKYSRDDADVIRIEVPEAYLTPKQQHGLRVTRVCNSERMFAVRLSDLPDIASQGRLVGRPSVIPLVAAHLALLSALCAGRSTSSVETLKDIIDVNILMDLVDVVAVPPIIHAGLINLFSSGVVINTDFVSLEDTVASMRCVVDDPNAPDPFVFEIEPEDEYLLRSREFAKQFLINEAGCMTSDEGKREELDAVVRLTKALLMRKCWAYRDYIPVVHAMTSLLDRRNDEASNDPEVFRDKVSIIHTLDLFIDVVVGIQAARITRDFIANPNDPPFPPICQFVSPDPYSTISEQFDQRSTSTSKRHHPHLHKILPESPHGTLHYMFEVLQDIACVHNWDLRRESIRCYCRLAHQWETLSLMMENVSVSTSTNTEMFSITKVSLKTLQRYLTSRRRSHEAAAAVQKLTEQLQSRSESLPKPGETTLVDLLGMYHQMKIVDVVLTISGELESISKVRTSETGLMELCLRSLQFLELCAAVDDGARQKIGDHMENLLFSSVAAPAPFMSVCKRVYIDPKGIFGLTSFTVNEVVNIIARGGQVGDQAVVLLQEILGMKDIAGRYIAKNQQTVWRSILGNLQVARLLRLHDTWTGTRGVEIRDAKLRNEEAASEVKSHLALLDVVFLVAKQNDLVKPEEIRYELFGPSGVDDLMEVVCNSTLPPTFRFIYVNLLQVLVVEDRAGLAALFNHRSLNEFLLACRFDIHCGSVLLEEQSTGLTSSRTAEVRREPSGKMVAPTYAEFSDLVKAYAFMGDFLCMAVFPCIRHLMEKFNDGARRLHPKVRMTLSMSLSDMVEATLHFVSSLSATSDKTTVNRVLGTPRIQRKKLRQYLETALQFECFGASNSPDNIDGAVATMAAYEVEWDEWNMRVETREQTAAVEVHTLNMESISKKWQVYIQALFGPLQDSSRHMAGGAGVILRNPAVGTPFFATLVSSLPYLPEQVVCRALRLMRQVIVLQDGDRDDCSVLLPFTDVEGLHDRRSLTLLKTKDQRQTIASTFNKNKPSHQLLPLVSELLSKPNARVREAAIETAIAVLDGGNQAMQQVMYDSSVERRDEQIYVYLRDVLATTRETLLTYIRIMQRGADPRDTLANLEQVTKVLRYTQLLCEGHFRENQEYLRVQPSNVVSVNVIEAMCDALDVVSRTIDFRTVSFATQLIVTLIETLQGPCKANQDFCVSAGVAERLVVALALTVEKDDHDGKLHEGLSSIEDSVLRTMQLKAVDGLLALIEGRAERQYLTTLVGSISLKTLCSCMDRSVALYEAAHGPLEESSSSVLQSFLRRAKSYVVPDDEEDELVDDLSLAVNVFIFIRSCLDHQNLLSSTGDTFEFVDIGGYSIKRILRKTQCFHAVNRKVGMVELLRGETVERCYFRILNSSSTNLLKKQKEALIKSVVRDSDNRRLQSFLELSSGLIEEIEFYNSLRRVPLVSLFQDFDYVLDYFTLAWALLINIAMMSVLDGPANPFDALLSGKEGGLLDAFGIVQIALQGALMLIYMIGPMRVNITAKTVAFLRAQMQDAVDDARVNLSVDEADVSGYRIDKLTLGERATYAFYHTCWDPAFQIRTVFFVAAVLGYTQSHIWHTIQLLHVTNKSSVLSNVLQAITTNGVSLILTSVLMVIVIYIFGAVSFFHFTEFFDADHNGRGYDCQSLVSCWYLHIDSIRMGGGIGDATSNPYFDDSNNIGFYYAFFRLLYFVTVIVIFLNIVFGIIVDSFAQLREAREEVETDQQSKCFICGIEQNEFDLLTPGGFEQHITSEHNMWHYVYFMHYLRIKEEDEFNGQEAEVFQKLEARDTSFFPIGQSMATRAAAVEPVDVEEKLAHLSAKVDAIFAHGTTLEDRIQRLSEAVLNELRTLRTAVTPPPAKRSTRVDATQVLTRNQQPDERE